MLFPGASRAGTVVELGTVGSTFDAVDDRAAHLTAWATLDQRAGRGRLGREWVSPAGKCLAATILVRTKRMREDAIGWLPLAGTWASFMGHWIAVAIFTVLALAELVTDQLPSTPSRCRTARTPVRRRE